jgi:O-antigen ligase
LHDQIDFAHDRLVSEQSAESALTRLPVLYASIRMFQSKPLFGWGYEQFDRFDRAFQGRVGNLISPEKDFGSHNLYLTILAEQGVVGLILFLGPAVYWLLRSKAGSTNIPRTGFVDRKLLGTLWLVLASHFIANNFSRMLIPFGLGMWWVALGFIASMVHYYSPQSERVKRDVVVER